MGFWKCSQFFLLPFIQGIGIGMRFQLGLLPHIKKSFICRVVTCHIAFLYFFHRFFEQIKEGNTSMIITVMSSVTSHSRFVSLQTLHTKEALLYGTSSQAKKKWQPRFQFFCNSKENRIEDNKFWDMFFVQFRPMKKYIFAFSFNQKSRRTTVNMTDWMGSLRNCHLQETVRRIFCSEPKAFIVVISRGMLWNNRAYHKNNCINELNNRWEQYAPYLLSPRTKIIRIRGSCSLRNLFCEHFLQTYNKKIQVIILHDITRNYGVLNFAHAFLSFCESKFPVVKKALKYFSRVFLSRQERKHRELLGNNCQDNQQKICS